MLADSSSVALVVELRVALGHLGLAVVVVHLRQRNALLVQLLRRLVPPHWEVLFERSAQVGAVGSGLRHDFGEGLVRALPVGALHGKERGERERGRQTENEVLSLGAQDGTHQRVGDGPTDAKVRDRLTAELLKLAAVELLHLDDLPLAEVVILAVTYEDERGQERWGSGLHRCR